MRYPAAFAVHPNIAAQHEAELRQPRLELPAPVKATQQQLL